MAPIILLALLAILPLTNPCPTPFPLPSPLSNTTSPLHPRSYGLPAPHPNNPHPGPWPTTTPGTQPLRYCYATTTDYDSLNAIVFAAINLWKPALKPNSALEIVPDNGDPEGCICGAEGVTGDALNLRDYSGERVTVASVGWDPTVKGLESHSWHELRFARVDTPVDGQGKAGKVGERDVVRMAHEIGGYQFAFLGRLRSTDLGCVGHALGFEHEHQRPDAAKFIEFDCKVLMGYAQMKSNIAAGTANGFQSGDTIERACTDLPTALRLGWSEVTQRLPIIQPPNTLGAYVPSAAIDLSSIMMYGSFDSHMAGVDPNKFDDKGAGAVLKAFTEKKSKIPGKKAKREYSRVSMGGKWPPRYVSSVSEGDVTWVKAMYPKT
ncbi:hypothetical protein M409DRAFT_53238 [Zasmidium cellare ATCC 36951]|uniref:Peptidase M12A domain-containing protein n=1 Tax=Zasmidium cellare ATCC 36951 TaxID=1080233 RepID=A0A6A6CN69_ZASCE|nr:uncharacterized protein M409DRAFT_53238 [Zasmidium cellare ATCC 36951]KAF2168585.1 hypothetical protein M409DRAFT_53238 [Zasmidium cellare ATCC 36951]